MPAVDPQVEVAAGIEAGAQIGEDTAHVGGVVEHAETEDDVEPPGG